MTPNANGKAAYARGYHDGGAGKAETDNLYQYRSRRLGGIAL